MKILVIGMFELLHVNCIFHNIYHHANMQMHLRHPRTLLYIIKLVFTGVYMYIIFALRHRFLGRLLLTSGLNDNLCFEQKYENIKIPTTISSILYENCHFYWFKNRSIRIAYAC